MRGKRKAGQLRGFLKILGPGLITGAADDDPSGIVTCSQAGAAFQYGLLWTVPLQVPLMIAVQMMCTRIGLVSGRDLAGVLRARCIPEISSSRDYLVTFVGVFGTTISPYLFFRPSAQEVDKQKDEGRSTPEERRGATRKEMLEVWADTSTGMIFSQIICYFIIIATGTTVYASGLHDIGTPAQAAQALQPIGSGLGAAILFSIGLSMLIGAGLAIADPLRPVGVLVPGGDDASHEWSPVSMVARDRVGRSENRTCRGTVQNAKPGSRIGRCHGQSRHMNGKMSKKSFDFGTDESIMTTRWCCYRM